MVVLSFLFPLAFAASVVTNEVQIPDAPSWVSRTRVNKVVGRIQRALEWDIRRISVGWYSDPVAFRKAHGFDDSVLAVSLREGNRVLVGPGVTPANFDGVFGHELVHVILFQKYKDAIPRWLEEGLANYLGGRGTVDYAWLAAQPRREIRSLVHPFAKASGVTTMTPGTYAKYHYMASTAAMELIASKCRIADLLQLSVGHGLESYLSTFCGISDLDQQFDAFLKRKARSAAKKTE